MPYQSQPQQAPKLSLIRSKSGYKKPSKKPLKRK
jgi:hypothetical protein